MAVRNLRVYVVELPACAGRDLSSMTGRVSDRLTDEDPFIVDLIRKLQREVREQRAASFESPLPPSSRWAALRDEAPPPSFPGSLDFERTDRDEDWPTERDLDWDD